LAIDSGEAASTDDQILMAGQAAAAAGVLLDQLERVRERFPDCCRQIRSTPRLNAAPRGLVGVPGQLLLDNGRTEEAT